MLKSNLEKIIVFNVLLNVNLVICLPKSHFSSYPRIKDFGDDDEHPIIISSAHQQLYHNEPFQFKRLSTTTKQPFLSRLPAMASDNYQDDKNVKTHSWVNVSVLPLTSRPLIITGPSTSSTTTTTTTTSTPRPVPRPTPRSTTTTTTTSTTTSTTTTTPSPSLVSSTTQSTVNKLSKPTKGVVRSELDLNTSSSQSNASIAHPLANQVDGPSASSFIQPLTLLIMSYLANKKINSLPIDRYSHGLPPPPIINSSFYDTSNRNQNDTETESRTIASWFGGLARRLKRPKHPNRRDHTVGPGRGSIPIPYETAPISLASLHGPSLAPIGRPLSGSSSDQIMLPGLLPQPEGFPGPFNPENSVLLPPDIMENSGIKYWLDFIEKGGTTDDLTPAHLNGSPAPLPPQLSSAHSTPPLGHQTIFEAAGSDHDEVDFNNAIKRRFKRPPAQAKPDGNRQNTRYRPNPHRPSNGASNGNSNSNSNGNQIDSHIQKHSYGETSDSYDGTDRTGNSNSLHFHDSDRHKQNEMSPRCDKFTDHICVDDFEYPEQAIVDEIYKRRDIFELMYSEVKGNIPLVDGIPRDVEESYSYETDEANDDTDENDDSPGDRNDVSNDERADPMYSAANSDPFTKSAVGRQGLRPGVSNKGNSNGQNGNAASKDASHGGYVCPSEVLYGKPKLARNIKGDWKVIVNAAEFTQTVRMEKCLRPNQRCNYVSNIGIVSRCAQVHSFHRLMVFEKGKGFYIDTFQIPTACSCHIRRTGGPTGPSPMSDLLGLNESPGSGGSNGVGSNGNGGGSGNGNGISSMGKSPTPLQLSNALWSILGSGTGSGPPPNNGQSLSGNPFSVIDNINSVNNDLLKAQLSVLSSIKNYPSLTGSISPESVLQQLTSQSDAIQNIQGLTNAFNQNSGFPSMNGKQPDSGGHNDQVEYLLPGMMYAEEPLSFQEHSDNLGGRLHSSHSTGSFSRGSSPTSSSHSLSSSGPGTGEISTGGAPLVQVIHVPVSSHPLSPQLQRHHGPTTTNLQFPVYNKPSATSNDLPTLTAYASASKSSADALKAERKPSAYFSSLTDTDRNKVIVNQASENHNNNNENKTNATSTYDSAVLTSTPKVAIAGASNSHAIHPQETSTPFDKNNPTNEHTAINENDGKDSNNNNNNDKSDSTGKTLANSIADGKVNFSYHPILEYIMPSQSSS